MAVLQLRLELSKIKIMNKKLLLFFVIILNEELSQCWCQIFYDSRFPLTLIYLIKFLKLRWLTLALCMRLLERRCHHNFPKTFASIITSRDILLKQELSHKLQSSSNQTVVPVQRTTENLKNHGVQSF